MSIVIPGFKYMRKLFLLMPQLTFRFAFPPPWLLVLDVFPTGSHDRGNPCKPHCLHRDSCAIVSIPTKTVHWLVSIEVVLRPLEIDGFLVVC